MREIAAGRASMSSDDVVFIRSRGRFITSVFFLFFTFQLLYPTTVFASQHAGRLDTDPPQSLARAGVSVVRLLVSYRPDKATTPGEVIECTGLGVLIASWPNQGPNDQNNWILTDGSLVNSEKNATCAATQPKAVLSSIQFTMSRSYTSQLLQIPALDLTAVQCSAKPCSNGMAIFSFDTDSLHTQPYLDVAGADARQVAGIGLTRSGTSLAIPALLSTTDPQRKQQFDGQIAQFLTPNQVPLKNGKLSGEAGTPIVNSNGELSGMLLSGNTITTAQEIGAFLGTVSALNASAVNPLHDNWNSGITNYYQKNYTAAYNAFQAAGKANPQFIGAQDFAQMASRHLAVSSAGGNSNSSGNGPPDQSGSIKIAGLNVPLLLLGVAALLVLAILFLLIALIVGRVRSIRRQQQQRLREEYAEAERRAAIDAQRLAEMEAARREKFAVKRTPTIAPMMPGTLNIPTIACPRCGTSVLSDATYCPNCHLQFGRTEVSMPAQGQFPYTNTVLPSQMASLEPVVLHQSEAIKDEPIKPANDQKPRQESVYNEKKDAATGSSGMGSRQGQRLGNYRLIRLIGDGGFAEVYLGEHIFLKTQAAIKVIRTRLTSEMLSNFIGEARTIAQLVHPHIVRVLEFGVEGKELDPDHSILEAEGRVPFLIMEYASGGTLRKRHPKGSRLPLSMVVSYVNQAADALQYAHDQKFIHRDIKPENMLIGHGGKVLMSDFGIAAVAHSEHSMSIQEMAGTIPYMAPEQIRNRSRTASDQYALAVVVYEWLCGVRPFLGSQYEIIDQHLHSAPSSLRGKVPSLPEEAEQTILKALSKDPAERFDTVKAFALALEQALHRI
jgi:hypothetical protein